MNIEFKELSYQKNAVDAVVDCFEGQPRNTGIQYRIDPGVQKKVSKTSPLANFDMFKSPIEKSFEDPNLETGFKNENILLPLPTVLENIQAVQRRQNLPLSTKLEQTKITKINLDIEMETGTGKTYCYIKTMFEMNRRFGWSKFIVVVPSIAIREGVKQSFQLTQQHFLE